MTRAARRAPLTAAEDAIAIDTTELTLDQVIDLISELALERAAANSTGE